MENKNTLSTLPDDLPFEKALEDLETLVSRMENGGLPLDELVRGFERGKLLAAHCRKQLDTLERKISQLASDDGATGVWEDFDAASGARNSVSVNSGSDDLPF